MHFLTAEQVFALAAAITDPVERTRRDSAECFTEFGLLVRFAAWTGLRAGEVAALRVGNVNPLRSEVQVVESVSEVHGALVCGPTKTYERRTVPVPGALAAELARHVEGRDPAEQVFGRLEAARFATASFTGVISALR